MGVSKVQTSSTEKLIPGRHDIALIKTYTRQLAAITQYHYHLGIYRLSFFGYDFPWEFRDTQRVRFFRSVVSGLGFRDTPNISNMLARTSATRGNNPYLVRNLYVSPDGKPFNTAKSLSIWKSWFKRLSVLSTCKICTINFENVRLNQEVVLLHSLLLLIFSLAWSAQTKEAEQHAFLLFLPSTHCQSNGAHWK